MSGRKPMSHMRSASSSTSTSTCERSILLSHRGPAAGRGRRQRYPRRAAGPSPAGPCSRRRRWRRCAHGWLPQGDGLVVCSASSRVGTIKARGCGAPALDRRCSMGRMKAAVLPVPVCAKPKCRASGAQQGWPVAEWGWAWYNPRFDTRQNARVERKLFELHKILLDYNEPR